MDIILWAMKYKRPIIIYENEKPAYYTYRKVREHTEETRSKISSKVNEYYENGGIEKKRQAMAKAVGIKVNKYDNNNNLLESYDSIKGAARANDIPQATLSAALKHNRKAGGFVWRKIPKEAST